MPSNTLPASRASTRNSVDGAFIETGTTEAADAVSGVLVGARVAYTQPTGCLINYRRSGALA